MKNIAIALDAGTPSRRNEITRFFSNQGWAYWHWQDDFWIVQVPDTYTPKTLNESIEKLPNMGTPTLLLFEFKGKIGYWGRNKAESWTWLNHIGTAE